MSNILLAQPRGFCAGVVRAVEIVQKALEIYGQPVYVLHEIVHNQHVVSELQAKGAVFVESLDEVPEGAMLIFSAHGVARAAVQQATQRGFRIIDATCPLVTKVHLEVTRHAKAGREVVLIGHKGHAEVNGTLGQYDPSWGGRIYLVESVEDVARLEVTRPNDMAYVTQTTLSMDDARQIIQALQARFPGITGPAKEDICYATQNRQNAVRSMLRQIDVLLVVGARNSSNSNRLREVGEQAGVAAYLVESAQELDPDWITETSRIGVTAGASTPEVLVDEVMQRLRQLGAAQVTEMTAEPEGVSFRLPDLVHRPVSKLN